MKILNVRCNHSCESAKAIIIIVIDNVNVESEPSTINHQSGTEISNLSKADLSQTSPKGIKKKSKKIKKEKEKRNHLGEGPS